MNEKLLFGIKPNGNLHIGHIESLKGHDPDSVIVLIANIHSSVSNNDELKGYKSLIKQFMFLGYKNILLQSKINFLLETAFFISKFTKDGELRRMHLVKKRSDANKTLFSSEYFYPLLMCADILLVGKKKIIVGNDQVQHIELFNHIYSRFPVDLKSITNKVESISSDCISGVDGRKMSKSYENSLSFFDSVDIIEKRINKIKTENTNRENMTINNELFNICNTVIDINFYRDKIAGCIEEKKGFHEMKRVLKEFFVYKRNMYLEEINKMDAEDIAQKIDLEAKKINSNNNQIISSIKKYLNF